MTETPDPNLDVPLALKTSDLGVRTASAVVMLAVAGGALWLGGWWWALFVGIVTFGVGFEWFRLARGFCDGEWKLLVWMLGAIIYLGAVAITLLVIRSVSDQSLPISGFQLILGVLGMVVGVDVGAYLLGRALGGPKIAPSISPSKTWAGLLGGILGAFVVLAIVLWWYVSTAHFPGVEPKELFWDSIHVQLKWAVVVAVCAQAGDFFESWMKRKAGVKDSGNIIPGHGGLFDRVDGLLAVWFVLSLYFILGGMITG